ncbi:MAG: hypothetical protein KF878_18780 [Planctomycetes bacterium]|nr:hypothetical protein [Planctomycetota bacterium]
MLGSISRRERRCRTCRGGIAPADQVDCPRCGAAVHVGCSWDAPRCGGCGEDLRVEVTHRARRATPGRLRARWEAAQALLRDLWARPAAVLAECHSDRGRWMGISVSLFLLGVALAVALTVATRVPPL